MTYYRNKLVSKKEISGRIGYPVEQIDHKQLFVVELGTYRLLVSYYTIVGYKILGEECFTVTDKKYSRTTSKQISGIKHKKQNHVEFVQQLEIILALNGQLYCNLYYK